MTAAYQNLGWRDQASRNRFLDGSIKRCLCTAKHESPRFETNMARTGGAALRADAWLGGGHGGARVSVAKSGAVLYSGSVVVVVGGGGGGPL